MNWKAILHSAIAAIVAAVLGAVEQWFHNGSPIPRTPDQWHEFIGVLITAALMAIGGLLKQSPIQPTQAPAPAQPQEAPKP